MTDKPNRQDWYCSHCGSPLPNHNFSCPLRASAPPKPAPSWPQDAPPLRTELLGSDGMGSASEADLKRAYDVDQPAPDAMRVKLRKLVDAVWNDATESSTVPSTEWANKLIDLVFSSAPVPPADGEFSTDDQCKRRAWENDCDICGNVGIGRPCKRTIHFSPAVAAEPVSLGAAINAGIDAIQAASPPVRGDREAINTAANEVVRRVAEYDDRTSPDDFPEALLITPSELHTELTRFADALSLTVQPVAPRLPQDTLDRLANVDASREEIKDALAKAYALYRWNAKLEDLPDDMKDDCYAFAESAQPGDGSES